MFDTRKQMKTDTVLDLCPRLIGSGFGWGTQGNQVHGDTKCTHCDKCHRGNQPGQERMGIRAVGHAEINNGALCEEMSFTKI